MRKFTLVGAALVSVVLGACDVPPENAGAPGSDATSIEHDEAAASSGHRWRYAFTGPAFCWSDASSGRVFCATIKPDGEWVSLLPSACPPWAPRGGACAKLNAGQRCAEGGPSSDLAKFLVPPKRIYRCF